MSWRRNVLAGLLVSSVLVSAGLVAAVVSFDGQTSLARRFDSFVDEYECRSEEFVGLVDGGRVWVVCEHGLQSGLVQYDFTSRTRHFFSFSTAEVGSNDPIGIAVGKSNEIAWWWAARAPNKWVIGVTGEHDWEMPPRAIAVTGQPLGIAFVGSAIEILSEDRNGKLIRGRVPREGNASYEPLGPRPSLATTRAAYYDKRRGGWYALYPQFAGDAVKFKSTALTADDESVQLGSVAYLGPSGRYWLGTTAWSGLTREIPAPAPVLLQADGSIATLQPPADGARLVVNRFRVDDGRILPIETWKMSETEFTSAWTYYLKWDSQLRLRIAGLWPRSVIMERSGERLIVSSRAAEDRLHDELLPVPRPDGGAWLASPNGLYVTVDENLRRTDPLSGLEQFRLAGYGAPIVLQWWSAVVGLPLFLLAGSLIAWLRIRLTSESSSARALPLFLAVATAMHVAWALRVFVRVIENLRV